MTLTSVPVTKQTEDHAHQGQRNREEHDKGMDQRFKGRGHDQVDQKDRQRQGKAKAGEGGLHLVDLASELGDHAGRRRGPIEDGLDVPHRRAEAPPLQVGAEHRGPLLLDPVDLGRSAILADLGHREQPQRLSVGPWDHQACARRLRSAVVVSRLRTRMSIWRSSSRKRVGTAPSTRSRRVSAMVRMSRPSEASRSRSKMTCSSGLPSSREERTSTRPGIAESSSVNTGA